MSEEADFQKLLVTANHTQTWWYNISPLDIYQQEPTKAKSTRMGSVWTQSTRMGSEAALRGWVNAIGLSVEYCIL
jgi:hypothetical protein